AGGAVRGRRWFFPQPTCANGQSCVALCGARDICRASVCRGRRPDELRNERDGCMASGRRLCRPRSQGGKASRPAGGAVLKVRAGHKRGDRADARPHNTADPTIRRRRGDRVNRREFITLLGGAAVAWPLAAQAQQRERMRRIGVLLNSAADDPAAQSRLTAFLQGLQELGWTHGRNVRIDIRWGADDAERVRKSAAELVALGSDVVLTAGSPTTGPLFQATPPSALAFL